MVEISEYVEKYVIVETSIKLVETDEKIETYEITKIFEID